MEDILLCVFFLPSSLFFKGPHLSGSRVLRALPYNTLFVHTCSFLSGMSTTL